MKKIYDWLCGNLDKVCHFLACVLIAIIFSAIILHTTVGVTVLIASICGLIAAIICGILKEVYDVINGGIFDTKDLLADLIGAIVGALMALLII